MEKTHSPPLFFRRVVVVLSVATHHPPPTHERGYSSIFSQWTAHTRMWGGNNGCCHARGKDIFRNEHGPPFAIVSSVAIVCPSFRSLMMLLSRILIPPFCCCCCPSVRCPHTVIWLPGHRIAIDWTPSTTNIYFYVSGPSAEFNGSFSFFCLVHALSFRLVSPPCPSLPT